MIGIYAAADAAYSADAIAGSLSDAWPQLEIRVSSGTVLPDLPFIGAGASRAWDDLLILVFGADQLPAALHGPVQREIDSARAQQRASRVLPVSTLPAHRRPPAPLQDVKAIHCPEPSGEPAERLSLRVGALLSLWLRGDQRRVFVSHRQADGQPLAAHVTAYLEAQGYDAWRDEDRLDGGDVVQDEIERTIADAHMLLLLDTPLAGESEWIAREVDAAIAGFVPIVSVVLRPPGTTGRAAESGVYGARELMSHRIEAQVDSAGVVELLDDAQLAGMLTAVEGYLSGLLRSQQALSFKVEETFRQAGFDWEALDARRFLAAGSKREDDWSWVRLLSHCSAVPPSFLWAVQALRRYRVDGGAPNADAFNHRIFVYEPPLPAPTLRRLARDHEAYRDPILRLLDPGRLVTFLNRYQADI